MIAEENGRYHIGPILINGSPQNLRGAASGRKWPNIGYVQKGKASGSQVNSCRVEGRGGKTTRNYGLRYCYAQKRGARHWTTLNTMPTKNSLAGSFPFRRIPFRRISIRRISDRRIPNCRIIILHRWTLTLTLTIELEFGEMEFGNFEFGDLEGHRLTRCTSKVPRSVG